MKITEQNIILIKNCLDFYANSENYSSEMISKDNGHFARSIIGIIKMVEEENSKIDNDLDNLLGLNNVKEL